MIRRDARRGWRAMLALLLLAGTPALAQDRTPRDETVGGEDPVTRVTRAQRLERDRLRFVSPELLEAPIDASTYVLGPGDVLFVSLVLGEVRSERLPVLPEGVVVVPGVGVVEAAGRTLDTFRRDLRRAISERYQNFEMYCYLALARQVRVYVTGEVLDPGTLAARPYERVSDVIERAGGLLPEASQRHIELRSPDGRSVPVDLGRFYARGDTGANPHVDAGQVIFVPVRRTPVDIVGAVARPGTYEARDGDTLADLLDLAGGALPRATLSHVEIDRLDPQGTLHRLTVDARANPRMLDDVVRVSVPSRLFGQRRVFVTDAEGNRQALYLGERETLADLLRRVPQVMPEADVEGVVLVSVGDDGKVRHVPVNMRRVLAGDGDLPLHDGDVLSLPAVRDYVFVSGFVARPGRYPFRADWTINDYIGQAGGTTSGGNLKRATVLSRDGERRKESRVERVGPGETIFIDRSTGGKIAGSLAILTNLSTLIISIVALTR